MRCILFEHQQGTGASPSPSPKAFINTNSSSQNRDRGTLGKLLLLTSTESQSSLEHAECAVPPEAAPGHLPAPRLWRWRSSVLCMQQPRLLRTHCTHKKFSLF